MSMNNNNEVESNDYDNSAEEFSQYLNLEDRSYLATVYEIREIPNCKVPTYQTVMTVKVGKGDNTKTIRFQGTIKGDALAVLLKYQDEVNQKDVYASMAFRCFGLSIGEPYQIKTGENKGKWAVTLGTSIKYVSYLAINGENIESKVLYHNKKQDETESGSEDFSEETAESLAEGEAKAGKKAKTASKDAYEAETKAG